MSSALVFDTKGYGQLKMEQDSNGYLCGKLRAQKCFKIGRQVTRHTSSPCEEYKKKNEV